MENNNIYNLLRKKILMFFSVSAFILYSIYSFLLAPLHVYLSTNVLYSATALPELVEFIYTACELTVFFMGFACIIYFVYRLGAKKSFSMLLVYSIFTFYKLCTNFSMSLIMGMMSSADDISMAALTGLTYLIIELFVLALLFFIFILIFKKAPSRKNLIPFSHMIDLKNPLQKSALAAAVIISAFKIISRIIYDFFYGAPQSLSDFLWMVGYYASDIFIGVIAYFVIIYFLLHFDSKAEKLKENR